MKVGFIVSTLAIAMLYVTALEQVNAAENWLKKGQELFAIHSYEEAITAYDIAIQMNPENAKAWYDKGNALKALSRITEADIAFAKAEALGYTDRSHLASC